MLAQAEANRDQAQANRDQARANSEQALANHVTARALMLAMQTQCDPSASAFQCDELHCWYNDAEEMLLKLHVG